MEQHPGAISNIPSKSHLEIDTRDIHEKRRNNVIEKIHESAMCILKKRCVELLEFKIVNQDLPALSNELVIKAMESATKMLNLSYSHKPEEYASPDDIANGVKLLALTLAKLSTN
ncbi:hypothetical protein L1887_31699 [Cichorium endivia]|nr:hypothetical protein L1887_31699 [Cichorium endivia]